MSELPEMNTLPLPEIQWHPEVVHVFLPYERLEFYLKARNPDSPGVFVSFPREGETRA
ncbi:MAG TPA: hypothetical protein VEI97_18070 [bacterium]|nr:hypothetical protein [bacterium]